MNKKERVSAALHGVEVDRVPISFWGHNYLKEWTAEELAETMLDNHRTFDWDFMKVNPRASYHVEDWGAVVERSKDPRQSPKLQDAVIRYPDDWRRIRALEPDRGALGEQLRALKIIKDSLEGDAYFIQTIFSPLSVAEYLAGHKIGPVKDSISGHRKALDAALDVISHVFAEYALACLEAGASGIYFATTGWASKDHLRQDEYQAIAMPYDFRVLEAVAGKAPLNVLHNCGKDIYFDLLADYPVAAISWDATLPGNPSLADGKQRTKKAVMGGVSEKKTLPDGTPEQVASEVRCAIEETGGRRVLIGPGCTMPPQTPHANLQAAARAVRGTG